MSKFIRQHRRKKSPTRRNSENDGGEAGARRERAGMEFARKFDEA
jgi:hypothetical protein